MAIYLDQQTRPYLERLIKKAIEKSDKDFIAVRLQKILQADSDRLQKIAECTHEYGEYTGFKQCCTKCETMLPNMGMSWELKKKTRRGLNLEDRV